jgi:hypothetical protein
MEMNSVGGMVIEVRQDLSFRRGGAGATSWCLRVQAAIELSMVTVFGHDTDKATNDYLILLVMLQVCSLNFRHCFFSS